MSMYAKFVKELLNGKCKWKNDENVTLAEEYSVIIRCKLPPKLMDPCRFMNPCSIDSLKIYQAPCDLGASII